MSSLKSRLVPLETLERVLPDLLRDLSMARAQIAVDQIRGTVEARHIDHVIFATATESDSSPPVAAAIAIQQPGLDGQQIGDMATIVHAGSLSSPSNASSADLARSLASVIDDQLHRRGTRFVQWATDVCKTTDDPSFHWCADSGFNPIGTLDYLNGLVPDSSDLPFSPDPSSPIHFEAIDLGDATQFQQFAELVERTYVETLDCPELANFRTAQQTLRGYQSSGAYDPNLWLRVTDSASMDDIGCIVLACHRPPSQGDAGSEDRPSIVVEIVYMGLVPQARGNGLGKRLVQRAFHQARALGATRIILGVDQRNEPARAIYELAGLQPMLHETVWVKSLNSVKENH